MRLLFDQNISPRILKKLPAAFEDSSQVRYVGLEDCSDMEIFLFAKERDFAIVTFDSDFVDLNALNGTPPKIIYLNTGNLTTGNISSLLMHNLPKIKEYIKSPNDDILQLMKGP